MEHQTPPDAAAIHAATLTLDTHVDVAWPNPADPRGETRRQVDFTRMARGGLRGVVFIAYTPQGPRTPEAQDAAGARAEAMLRSIRASAAGGDRVVVSTAGGLEATHAAGKTAVLLAVENGNAMGRDLSRLALWRDLGAIYLTITHDGHNDLADAARPRPELGDGPSLHGGLSPLGRDAVREMNRLGLIVDVSHVARSTFFDCVASSRAPVVATHACCAAIRQHPRNLDDAQLDALRDTGGLIQITAVSSFLRAPPGAPPPLPVAPVSVPGGTVPPPPASVADIADHVEHAVRRIGIEHVGLSSDFDGGGGVLGWADASESGNLTAELVRRGFGAREIGLLWSGNFLRAWRATEAVAAAGD